MARAARVEPNKTKVDLSRLARELIDAIKADCPATSFAIEEGLEAHCDASLIRFVLDNLLSNACKFSRNVAEPRVEVGRIPNEANPVFFVRDNGVGFDPLEAEKLFNPFSRLHGGQGFEGTGVGLSNVKRIIIRHGGTVWADSTVGSGATFYFSLPLASEEVSDGAKNEVGAIGLGDQLINGLGDDRLLIGGDHSYDNSTLGR
jgi:signal transduction histidine kinase